MPDEMATHEQFLKVTEAVVEAARAKAGHRRAEGKQGRHARRSARSPFGRT